MIKKLSAHSFLAQCCQFTTRQHALDTAPAPDEPAKPEEPRLELERGVWVVVDGKGQELCTTGDKSIAEFILASLK